MDDFGVRTRDFVEVGQVYIATAVKEALLRDAGKELVNFDEAVFPEFVSVELGRSLDTATVSRSADEYNVKAQMVMVNDLLGRDFAHSLMVRFGGSKQFSSIPSNHYADVADVGDLVCQAFAAGRRCR